MKLTAFLLVLLSLASGASGAGWSHGDPARPFTLRMAQLPKTEADLDRASRQATRLHNFASDVTDELNIRDGKAEIFDEHQLDGSAEFSGSLDAHGATLRLRW